MDTNSKINRSNNKQIVIKHPNSPTDQYSKYLNSDSYGENQQNLENNPILHEKSIDDPINNFIMFVGGLLITTSEQQLRLHILKFIPSDLIGSVRIVKSKKTKKSKGYGFVEVKDQELAQFLTKGSIKHIKELINESQESNEGCIFVLNERKLDFQLANNESADKDFDQDNNQQIQARRLFVGGLSPDTDDNSLFNYFTQFGKVTSAYVIKHFKTGISKKFGFVVYEDINSIEKVLFEEKISTVGKNLKSENGITANHQIDIKSQKKISLKKHFLDDQEISVEQFKQKNQKQKPAAASLPESYGDLNTDKNFSKIYPEDIYHQQGTFQNFQINKNIEFSLKNGLKQQNEELRVQNQTNYTVQDPSTLLITNMISDNLIHMNYYVSLPTQNSDPSMNGFNFQNETFDNMLTKTSQDFTKQQNCDTQSNFTVAKNSYQTARQNFKLMQNPAEGINYGYKAEEVLLMKKRVDKFALNDIYKISAHIYTSLITNF